eukprot:CAMPEP_0113846196 /NCGR_PEP_ID=MMETSP0372-20130328/1175_1 /TAXON_ID=340204 /ORGANISM="Lankesteria abbotti" /LENGTH=276 /DNA_ID=CAMNT_0000815317 /DNA_START=185 /DNA_END=1015 /DNA_ORIENTATION=+ /assembly_acc=CAM_ASM_000359
MPKGKALDLIQLSAVQSFDCKFEGTNTYETIADSDIVVVIAGVPRKPGMSRDDLIEVNAGVMVQVGAEIKKHAPNSYVVCVTNPLDVMVQVLYEATGFPHHRVVGMAGVLDSSRFRLHLAEKLGVSVEDVQALVLGGHGDTMVPITRFVSVSGIPLDAMLATGAITQADVDAIVKRTTNAGGEVLGLLGTGSAYHAPAASACEMVESILRDKKRLMPCAAYLQGQYGVTGHYIGVPIVLGAGGVEKIIEVPLKENEMAMFKKSADAVIELHKKFKK